MLGPELGLMELSEVEYTHFQHLIQAHVEAHITPSDLPYAKSHPSATVMVKDTTGSIALSPLAATQAIDLSTSTDDHSLVMPGEKTPASYGEVPGFVLARVRGEDSQSEPYSNSSTFSQNRSISAARVCLEKRFNTMSANTPRYQDIKSAVLSNFLTMLQQSAEAQDAVKHPQMRFDVSSPFVGGEFTPINNMSEQVIGHIPHMIEPNKHQGLIIPKSFSINFCCERVGTKSQFTDGCNLTEDQLLLNIENDGKVASTDPDSAGKSGSSTRKKAQPHMSHIQRRERHNIKERERRKRIRLYCDELNMLVPFCESDTDKVTTLQWTTAFLKYINKTYGDTFQAEFQRAFTDGKEHFLKSSPCSGNDPIRRQMDTLLSIPLAVEQ
ncbi:hypothetical protein PBY51_000841 [Eleginops maclovinus]|uniref:BHLH domain-containing protein n=2 Tax=Eleginops maclovinus TaxID=56733 RepID=A0AAN7XNA4_ELEMC|nr:hypothetical protein PBY51_000841 [Eleginops maclovinus]